MPVDPLAPPRPELLALLDAVKDHPDDDTPRLVLADWLDEQANPLDAERAKFIREDITAQSGQPIAPAKELAQNRYARQLYPGSPEYQTAEKKRKATEERLERWLGKIGRTVYTGGFHRGLPILSVPPTWFLRSEITPLLATEAFSLVQLVRIAEGSGAALEEMVTVPEFRYVPGMSFYALAPLGTAHSEKILASPNLSGLRQIDFYRANPGAAGMQALAKNPALARLRKLILGENKLVDKAVLALADSPHLTSLTNLNLEDNNIGNAGAEALASSAALANLRELDLTNNPRLTERGKQLLRDKFGDRVKLG